MYQSGFEIKKQHFCQNGYDLCCLQYVFLACLLDMSYILLYVNEALMTLEIHNFVVFFGNWNINYQT